MNDLSYTTNFPLYPTPQDPPRFVDDQKEKVEFPNIHSQQPILNTGLPYVYEDIKDDSSR